MRFGVNPFPPCGGRWPEGPDEGSAPKRRLRFGARLCQPAPGGATPHPADYVGHLPPQGGKGRLRHERTAAPLLSAADRLHAAVRRVRAGGRRRAVRADRRCAGGAIWGRGGGKRRRIRGRVRAWAGAGVRLCRRRRAGGGGWLRLRIVGRRGAGGRAARACRGDHRRRRSPIASFCGSPRSARLSRRASARTSAPNSRRGSIRGFRAGST